MLRQAHRLLTGRPTRYFLSRLYSATSPCLVPSPRTDSVPVPNVVHFNTPFRDIVLPGADPNDLDDESGIFTFEEEPHTVPLSVAPGYFPLKLGTKLMGIPEIGSEYVILRKLGWGSDSSVWMAQNDKGKYVAIKVLSCLSSLGIMNGDRYELQMLTRLHRNSGPGYEHCTLPIDVFPADSVHGNHVCIVFPLHGMSVQDYMTGFGTRILPLQLVKSLVRQTLSALSYMHSLDLVHTDIKTSNLLICIKNEKQLIDDFVQKFPAEQYPARFEPSLSPEPIITVKTQPLTPLGAKLEEFRVCLSDFGEARPLDTVSAGTSAMPTPLRAPEIILEHTWGKSIDIWATGCLASELITKTRTFDLDAPNGMSFDQVHLARIKEFLGSCYVGEGGKSSEFFDDAGHLRRPLPSGFNPAGTLNDRLISSGLRGSDLEETDAFIRRCMPPDPQLRASADELLKDIWFENAFSPHSTCN